jgi:hypothetical protein
VADLKRSAKSKTTIMGAWANDPFGNDTALDWVSGLEDTDDLSLIETTIQAVLDAGEEYLEAPAGDEAIAAADVLARLKGRFYVRNSYTESIDDWVAAHPIKPSPELISKALQALDRILNEPSELLELWEGDDDWRQQIAALKERLK